MDTLLKNCMVLELGNLVQKDILIKDDKIFKIENNIKNKSEYKVININNRFVSPGFIDMHVHLREPGFEDKETIKTGTEAAARGGYTLVCAMPNVNPVPDNIDTINHILELINKNAIVKVLPYSAISKNIKNGSDLVDMEKLKDKVCGFSNDGFGIQSTKQMYETMKNAHKYETLISAHCEDEEILYGGYVHQGKRAIEEGWKGITSLSESIQIARDTLIAEETNARYHVCHISTKEGVRIVREAKARGVNISCEATPHHLLLTEYDVLDTNFKMNPPVRGLDDKHALVKGLLDGTIDCVATDHAPHTHLDKQKGLVEAPFGVVGLETAFPLIYTNFVKTKMASLEDIVNWFSLNPAKRLNLMYGKLVEGRVCDITVIDLDLKKKIDKTKFYSKGKNTPFDGIECYGWPVMTFVNGKQVYKDGEVYE